MSNYSTLKAAISAVIKENNNHEITGQVLQTTLLAMVDSLAGGYLFKGIATPATVVGTPDENVFYIGGGGLYSNFGATPVHVPDGCIGIFTYNGSFENHIIPTGGVFDISAYNAVGGTPATYEDLTAALGTGGANIPDYLRKGGMSVKFIQGNAPSSDNKYFQARCMADEFTTDITQWQCVDEKPIAGSHNLVESGGVAAAIKDSEIVDGSIDTKAELSLVDDDDNCIAQFKDGHIKTKEFDSRDNATKTYVNNKVTSDIATSETVILNKVAEVDNLENKDDELAFVDEEGECILLTKDGHIRTKYFDSSDVMPAKKRGTIITEFNGLSGSGWTVTTNKKSATCSTANSFLQYGEQNIAAWNFQISACFIPTGTTFCVGIGKRIDYVHDLAVNSSLFALKYDGATSKLVVYRFDSSNEIYQASETILQNISLQSGKKYWLTVKKATTNYSKYEAVITDEYGNIETISNISCGLGSSLAGYGWGAPCVFMISGNSVTVSDFSFGLPVCSEIKCMMLGHSWIESNTQSSEHNNSFCGLVETALGGSDYCINLGRGGLEAFSLVELVELYKVWFSNSKYALIGIGLNDLNAYIGTSSFAEKEIELEQRMTLIENNLRNVGIIPIWLSVAWTYLKGKPSVDSINPWMKNNLGCVVDINKVFEDTSGNLVESAFVSDGNHPTTASCAKIYNCIKAQAAYLFNQ